MEDRHRLLKFCWLQLSQREGRSDANKPSQEHTACMSIVCLYSLESTQRACLSCVCTRWRAHSVHVYRVFVLAAEHTACMSIVCLYSLESTQRACLSCVCTRWRAHSVHVYRVFVLAGEHTACMSIVCLYSLESTSVHVSYMINFSDSFAKYVLRCCL